MPDGGTVLNTMNGDQNLELFSRMQENGLTPDKWPVMSFSIGEPEINYIGANLTAGSYAAWNYFEVYDSVKSTEFVKNLRGKYGDAVVASDPMEAAYVAVNIWSRAVVKAGSFDVGLPFCIS